jgi:DNA-binding MarR family transcriptional regulator
MSDSHSDLALLIDAVARLHGRTRSAFAPARDGTGLSDMEATVLVAVVAAHQSPTVPQIGRSLGHPRQVIQRAANSLVEAGLIELADNPDHKRASLLLPTAAGNEVQHRANARANGIAESLMRVLSREQVREATTLLTQIRGGIEAHYRSPQQ